MQAEAETIRIDMALGRWHCLPTVVPVTSDLGRLSSPFGLESSNNSRQRLVFMATAVSTVRIPPQKKALRLMTGEPVQDSTPR
jgi:hypothetical protein